MLMLRGIRMCETQNNSSRSLNLLRIETLCVLVCVCTGTCMSKNIKNNWYKVQVPNTK